MKGKSLPIITFEHKRDAYGFAVRPQHWQRYREYANIYKEEEEERSQRWKDFLERQAANSGDVPAPTNLSLEEGKSIIDPALETIKVSIENCDLHELHKPDGLEDAGLKKDVAEKSGRTIDAQIWADIRPSLSSIDQMMAHRVKKRKNLSLSSVSEQDEKHEKNHLAPNEEARASEDSDDEFYDVERSDLIQEALSADGGNVNSEFPLNTGAQEEPEKSSPWKEELECLVRGGVPMALRGELWQAFVGVGARRFDGYYSSLLDLENVKGHDASLLDDAVKKPKVAHDNEKWKGQIEKDLPRTFPGHPALDEGGRNALRRLLTAYARHNPSVGYCQAMNFFAGLLLLLMPEENAFWTLVGIIDDIFDGYYTEEMIESQVDQVVLEDLVHERFPKFVNHLDYLGVQVAWVTGPWFLSILVNMLPWESVLRVWDVLLFEGNRVMLFRTALAIIELYGPAIVTTKDAGDAITLLQSLAGSTFDSSQLVLTASMGYQSVNELKLLELREKCRPSVISVMEERSRGLRVWRDSKGLATKLYSFKHDAGPLISEAKKAENLDDMNDNGDLDPMDSDSSSVNGILSGLAVGAEVDSLPDPKEQVIWLKVELCRLLQEKRSATLRAEELETALMEMVKQDNRRLLSAKIEQLEQEVHVLRQSLEEKKEQEQAMIQILMRVEQEQKVTEDARLYVEQDAAAQRHAVHALQEKYEETMALLAQMENRAVMAESMLEATLQYQSSQQKALSSPRFSVTDQSSVRTSQDSPQEVNPRKVSLLSRPFGLGWRDKNKSKQSTPESNDATVPQDMEQTAQTPTGPMNGHEDSDK